jgi:hypothetical protein
MYVWMSEAKPDNLHYLTRYYFAGSQRIAVRANNVVSYLLGDHLGSTSIAMSADGGWRGCVGFRKNGSTQPTTGVSTGVSALFGSFIPSIEEP